MLGLFLFWPVEIITDLASILLLVRFTLNFFPLFSIPVTSSKIRFTPKFSACFKPSTEAGSKRKTVSL